MSPVGPAQTNAAAFFDVDGTLSATRSTSSLIWLRARQHAPWRHRLWLASLIWRAPLAWLADRVSRDHADRMVFGQFAGLSQRDVRMAASQCCRELLLPACFPEALAELEMHRTAGRRVVLLSGGIDLVLQPLAAALGADLIAQQLVVEGDRLTGDYRRYALIEGVAVRSQADGKRLALQRYAEMHGIDLAASYAYGDSVNDIGMLASVGTAISVNPDRRLTQEARRLQWEIRRWQL